MPLRPSYPVRTTRLLLRPLRAEDAFDLLAYRSLPEVCRWVPFEPMDAETIAVRLRGQWAATTLEGQGDALTLGVELAATGQVIGDVMLRWLSAEHSCGEVGYVFHPAFGGLGYATEAAHAVLHLAFDDLGLHRAIARIDARNVTSIRVAARLGMRQEAHLVENERFKGEWSDELDFGLLEREWLAQHRDGCRAR
ncbi:MAG TPA: GNAT family N-acetyltransferase [Propionibacteriaceae bacterium]|nr:GNAT family N-acetyltransferase [Propionibacteriaceae bacterium]